MKTNFRKYTIRLLFSLLIALIFVGLISESAHILQKEQTDRPPTTVKLLIPAGTADQVAVGEAETSIPKEMTFVIGDKLLVENRDNVPHELGPLYIPAGSSASLVMENANKYALGCTFQPSKYLNFNIKARTTTKTRLQAIALAAPPTTIFFFIYSLLVFPIPQSNFKTNPLDTAGVDTP